MATSTLVQYLEKSQTTISGGTVPVGADSSNRSQTETFLTETAIVKGDWVAVDTSQTGASKVLVVVQAGVVATGNGLAIGVALESVTGTVASPQQVKVCVAGYCETANVLAATAAGSSLSAAITTAGRAASTAAGSFNTCGVALTLATAGNVAEVLVYKQF